MNKAALVEDLIVCVFTWTYTCGHTCSHDCGIHKILSIWNGKVDYVCLCHRVYERYNKHPRLTRQSSCDNDDPNYPLTPVFSNASIFAQHPQTISFPKQTPLIDLTNVLWPNLVLLLAQDFYNYLFFVTHPHSSYMIIPYHFQYKDTDLPN